MMRLKLSLALILLLFASLLSAQTLQPDEKKLQNPSPSPSGSNKPPHTKPAQSAKHAKSDQGKPEIPPIIVNVSPPAKTKEESDHEAEDRRDKSSADWWMVKFNGALVFFTFILILVGSWQGRQNWRAANAATTAAEIAKRTLDSTQETAQSELRAYVGIHSIIIAPTTPLNAKVRITNSGKTMAREVTVRIASMLHLVGEPEFGDGELQPKIIVMPNGVCGFSQDVPIKTGASYRDFYDHGFGTIYVWGRIDYLDVFGKPHWTTFRFQDEERISPDGVYVVEWTTKYADEGNDGN